MSVKIQSSSIRDSKPKTRRDPSYLHRLKLHESFSDHSDHEEHRIMKMGESFGDIALINKDCTRTATIRAYEDAVVATLTK